MTPFPTRLPHSCMSVSPPHIFTYFLSFYGYHRPYINLSANTPPPSLSHSRHLWLSRTSLLPVTLQTQENHILPSRPSVTLCPKHTPSKLLDITTFYILAHTLTVTHNEGSRTLPSDVLNLFMHITTFLIWKP